MRKKRQEETGRRQVRTWEHRMSGSLLCIYRRQKVIKFLCKFSFVTLTPGRHFIAARDEAEGRERRGGERSGRRGVDREGQRQGRGRKESKGRRISCEAYREEDRQRKEETKETKKGRLKVREKDQKGWVGVRTKKIWERDQRER